MLTLASRLTEASLWALSRNVQRVNFYVADKHVTIAHITVLLSGQLQLWPQHLIIVTEVLTICLLTINTPAANTTQGVQLVPTAY